VVSAELERQKEANARAPATTMKNLVARLKVQLEEKEQQQQVRALVWGSGRRILAVA